jgi:hypothetical protein
MAEMEELLKRIDDRLTSIECRLANPKLTDLVTKPFYSCAEVAELTQKHGTKKAKPFTVRLACKDRRIPEAYREEDRTWRIPREAVLRILSEGIPPERRQSRSAS